MRRVVVELPRRLPAQQRVPPPARAQGRARTPGAVATAATDRDPARCPPARRAPFPPAPAPHWSAPTASVRSATGRWTATPGTRWPRWSRPCLGADSARLQAHAPAVEAAGAWAVDVALCDLLGKEARQPLARLWGMCQDRIRAYVSPGQDCFPISTDVLCILTPLFPTFSTRHSNLTTSFPPSLERVTLNTLV